MRLHVLALPNTQVNDDFLTCAYTQKVAKFCAMMGPEHDIILYANEGVSDETRSYCSEVVTVLFEDERREWFGEGFDTALTEFIWDADQPYWKLANARIAGAVMEREEPGDFLLMSTSVQMPVARASRHCCITEPFVGYEGIEADFCAYESHAWQSHVYGLKGWRNGRAFDAVIPNYFDPADFLHEDGGGTGDYVLFMGRVVNRKGPHIAADIARRAGIKLLIAGPGMQHSRETFKTVEGLDLGRDGVEYVGTVGKKERAELLYNAKALIVPTMYVEPFGGVAAEAMMAGCPVIGSDWGAMPDYLPRYATFRTLRQGVMALENVIDTDRTWWATEGYKRFSFLAVYPQFDEWLTSLATLRGDGYYA